MPEYIAKEDKALIKAATGLSESSRDDWAKENVDTYKLNKTSRESWYSDRVEYDNFYHNVQYKGDEEVDIIARGQAPLAINITYAIMKQMIALLTSADPTWDVDPVSDTDKEYAYRMRALLNASWYYSRGRRQISQVVKDGSVIGIGYQHVLPRTDQGLFGVQYKHLPYHQVYPSLNTTEIDFSDAENIILSKVVSHHQAAELLGLSLKQIQEIAESEAEILGEDSRSQQYLRYVAPQQTDDDNGLTGRIRIIQRHQMEMAEIFIVRPKQGGQISQKIFFSVSEDLRKMEKAGAVTIEKTTRKVLAKYISAGEYCRRYYIPIDSYNIVPFIDEFNGTPYPMGEVDFLYGIQRAINKFILLGILNATLANNMKMMAPKGVIDRETYESNYSVPGVLIEYDWTEGQPEPTQINPVPFSNEFFAMPKNLIGIAEYITGMFGVVQGSPEGAPRTASGLFSLQNYGGQKVKLLGRNLNDALSAAGDVAIALYQNYAPYNQVIHYYDEQSSQMERLEYNTLSAQGGEVRIKNDLSIGKFRCRAMVQQNYGSERELKATMLSNLMAQTRNPALLEPVLKLADIPEADAIIKKIDALAQANAEKEQLGQQLQRLQQINQQMENELLKKSRSVDIAQFEAQLDKMYNKIEKELGIKIAEIKSELDGKLKTSKESKA